MTEAQKGVVALIAACTVWGLSPIYYKALSDVPPPEVLSHRSLWSLVIFTLVLIRQGRLAGVTGLFVGRRAGLVVLATAMISLNWYIYIVAIQAGHGMQSSLGYYIFPLVAVLIGFAVFHERMAAMQVVAVVMAVVAVLVLTIGTGTPPWVALMLAVTFGIYAALKRVIGGSAVTSVTAEMLLLAPFALAWLMAAHLGGSGAFGHGWRVSLMLAFSGVITALPLMWFSAAAQRVSMTTFGLIQFVNPTLQFLCATLIFAEPFSRWHMLAFALIWAALAVYSVASLRTEARDRPVLSG